MIDYSNLLLDAVHCAQEAGKIHLSYFRKGNYSVQAKHGNESDIVTSADKAAETAIINFIHTHYPAHALEISDQALLMLPEHQFLFGKTEDVVTPETLTRAFGVEVTVFKTQLPDGRIVSNVAAVSA